MCRENPQNFKIGRYFRLPCAWPWRLNHYINDLLGFEAVQIENIAVGGINTDVGEKIVNFGLYPESFLPGGPDVIINAFSSNDMHIKTMQDATASNETIEEAVFRMTQKFVRAVLKKCDSPPMLIFVDDYLGNEQRTISELMTSSKAIRSLADYYGFMAISFADSFRHIVYGSVEESWFSPPWVGSDGWERQIHPGFGFHTVAPIIFTFNIMNAVISFCNEEAFSYCLGSLSTCAPSIAVVDPSSINGAPKTLPDGLPPPLTSNLELEHVTSLWRQESKEQNAECLDRKSSKSIPKVPCSFAWISGINSAAKDKDLRTLMEGVTLNNVGWEAVKDHDKVGLVVTGGVGSKLSLGFETLSTSVNTVTLMAMKSYGDEWYGSEIEVCLFRGKDNEEAIFKKVISGYHKSQTSVSYTYNFELDDDKSFVEGEYLKLDITFVAGKKFKVTGMGLCS